MPACWSVAGGMMNSAQAGVLAMAGHTDAGPVPAAVVSDGDGDRLAVSDDVDFVLFLPPI